MCETCGCRLGKRLTRFVEVGGWSLAITAPQAIERFGIDDLDIQINLNPHPTMECPERRIITLEAHDV